MTAPFMVPILVTLRDEINARWPNRSTLSDGWIGDAAHAARHSDHNPELDGSVDAFDITANAIDPQPNDPPGDWLAQVIADDPRLSGGGYVIWNGRISNPDIDGGAWRVYTGESKHTEHIHVSVPDRTQNSTTPWLQGVDDVTAEDLDNIRDIVQNNTDKVLNRVNEVKDDLEDKIEHSAKRTRVAMWKAEGKTLEEINALEAAIEADGG